MFVVQKLDHNIQQTTGRNFGVKELNICVNDHKYAIDGKQNVSIYLRRIDNVSIYLLGRTAK